LYQLKKPEKDGEDKSAPSFKKYIKDRKPNYALRFSKRGYRKDGDITNIRCI